MSAQLCDFVEVAAVSMDKAAVPFATEFVTLSRLEHIELVMDAKRYKGLHERASERALWLDSQRLQDMRKARELFALCEQRHQQELQQIKDRGAQCEAALRAELELERAKVRDLQQRLFGRKSERSKGANEGQVRAAGSSAPRGHQRGKPGHGRTMVVIGVSSLLCTCSAVSPIVP